PRGQEPPSPREHIPDSAVQSVRECVMSRWSLLLIGLGLVVCTSSAYAQRGDSGAIVGHVYDGSGMPVKGVRVTITSLTQIGGKRVATSDAEGFFRFPALQPGDFELEAEAR